VLRKVTMSGEGVNGLVDRVPVTLAGKGAQGGLDRFRSSVAALEAILLGQQDAELLLADRGFPGGIEDRQAAALLEGQIIFDHFKEWLRFRARLFEDPE